MNKDFQLHISEISEIEAVELQNEIQDRAKIAQTLQLSPESLPGMSSSGDPGLVAALLTYAPQVVPALAAALAAWIVAGRKTRTSQGRRIVITRDGIVYSDVKVSDIEREASGKPLETVLEKVLAGAGGSGATTTPVK